MWWFFECRNSWVDKRNCFVSSRESFVGANPTCGSILFKSHVVRVVSPWDAVKAGSYEDEESWVKRLWKLTTLAGSSKSSTGNPIEAYEPLNDAYVQVPWRYLLVKRTSISNIGYTYSRKGTVERHWDKRSFWRVSQAQLRHLIANEARSKGRTQERSLHSPHFKDALQQTTWYCPPFGQLA